MHLRHLAYSASVPASRCRRARIQRGKRLNVWFARALPLVAGPLVLGCLPHADTVFVLSGPRRTRADFVRPAPVKVGKGTRIGAKYEACLTPKVITAGQQDVRVEVALSRPGMDFAFDPAKDSFYLRSQAPRSVRVLRPVGFKTPSRGRMTATIDSVESSMVGYWELVLKTGRNESEAVPFSLRVVDKLRIALTFDDGPSVQDWKSTTTTAHVMDVLAEQGIAAAFFVLSSPDHVLWKEFRKADDDGGFRLLKRAIAEGHVLACHWGGDYGRQTQLHPSRVRLPADADSPLAGDGSALAGDLYHCMTRIRQAYAARGDFFDPDLVRPPFWTYRRGLADARPTYESLGLKMVLTDSMLHDGGYAFLVPLCMAFMRRWMTVGLRDAITNGHADVVLTMHDSNSRTARGLRKTLEYLRKKMEAWGYVEGEDWDFVKDRGDLLRILRAKQRFHSEPETLVRDTSREAGW